jgi:hypothetical protein
MSHDNPQVVELLTAALEAVTTARIPDDLRPVAFGRAVDLLSGTDSVSSTNASSTQEQSNETTPIGDQLAKIARRMGIEAKALAYIYEIDSEDVTLVVQRSKLSKDRTNASREVALLYAAARQATGIDNGHTSSANIRQRVSDMGVLDESNFAAKLALMRDWFAMKGTGAKREFKVTQHGYEEAGKLITRLTGASGS